jgi:hypothetical protein
MLFVISVCLSFLTLFPFIYASNFQNLIVMLFDIQLYSTALLSLSSHSLGLSLLARNICPVDADLRTMLAIQWKLAGPEQLNRRELGGRQTCGCSLP